MSGRVKIIILCFVSFLFRDMFLGLFLLRVSRVVFGSLFLIDIVIERVFVIWVCLIMSYRVIVWFSN